MMMKNDVVLLIHYGEIGLKGKNKAKFERKLLTNLKSVLDTELEAVYVTDSRIICELTDKYNRVEIIRKLSYFPGIEYFAFAIRSALELEELKRVAVVMLTTADSSSNGGGNNRDNTFKIVTKRSNKRYPYTSMELNRIIGEHIVNTLGKKVNLDAPEIALNIEICSRNALLYTETYRGVGGLPVGISGKLIALLSGGIDSPIASFLMMKRGCKISFVHFYNRSISSAQALDKVRNIVKCLTKVQLSSTLYLIPFERIQHQIIKYTLARYRMLIYRRFMLKIASELAKIVGASGIVTGDSVGQVASQTLQNLSCIYDATELPLYTPLIGMNKLEIINLAKMIGTYKYSILPYEDCCAFMIARHPETHADLNTVRTIETELFDQQSEVSEATVIREAIANAQKESYSVATTTTSSIDIPQSIK